MVVSVAEVRPPPSSPAWRNRPITKLADRASPDPARRWPPTPPDTCCHEVTAPAPGNALARCARSGHQVCAAHTPADRFCHHCRRRSARSRVDMRVETRWHPLSTACGKHHRAADRLWTRTRPFLWRHRGQPVDEPHRPPHTARNYTAASGPVWTHHYATHSATHRDNQHLSRPWTGCPHLPQPL